VFRRVSEFAAVAVLLPASLGALPFAASGLAAQAPGVDVAAPDAPTPSDPGEWNAPETLDLIRRARQLRQSNAVDPDLRTYAAEARGYVYFFFDRPDSAETVLVKADQVALDVWWRAPSHTRQTIVGLRDEKLLPTKIRYHLDHLTVVQDDFGDLIRLGDGDEVTSVVHPVAPGAETLYDYRLSDSLTISYAGGVVRVHEVRVRPRDFDRPGFVGSIYLDRDRAAIVRMRFSFTPASYVDDYLDYIRVSLDNSLWEGRWWLPYRQEIEIRREIPVFDMMAGSTIRGSFDIRSYDFNVELPDDSFVGRSVRAVSPARQRSFEFERGLFDELEETGGLRPPPSIVEVETQVREVAENHVMSGLVPIRLHGGRLSDFARYDRAEGIFVGAGLTLRPYGTLLVRSTGGYAFGRKRGSGAIELSRGNDADAGWASTLEASWDALGDIGGYTGATLLENTISSAAGSEDYLDPYFRRGVTLSLRSRGEHRVGLQLRFERHLGATDVVSDGPTTEFRPVRSILEGTLGALTLSGRFSLPGSGSMDLRAEAGRLAGHDYASLDGSTRWAFSSVPERWSGEISLAGGVVSNGAPPQKAWLLGGRYTLLGHEYRLFAGRAYWLAKGEVTVPVRPPWLGIRAIAAVGSTHLGTWQLPADWNARDSRGLRGTVGLGLSIGYDAFRFDVGRAVWGTGWEALVSLAPQFRSWL
jgi:hypothetical protein